MNNVNHYIYRVANKFSDTLNELLAVNCLISNFFVEISTVPTLSEKFNQINQAWPELQPQTWSEVNLKK